ncbi:MAG: flippase-like domain-containing protein [Nitrospina sp.]|jgi:glycosyltransferase 2 family protein|nr:flippase-like domain-containing protein [Nitrospina sp.]MBT6600218.1 flippase-like domain-containing protein [Nitrospina sp.]
MPNLKKKKILLLIAWIFSTYLLFLCFREIELEQAWENVKQVEPIWLFIGFAGHFSIFIFWARQWIIFLPMKASVTFKEMFEINALMSTTMNILPFPGGHAFGVFLLAKKKDVGHAAALSVMSLDQLTEGIAKLTVLLIVSYLTPLPPLMKKGILILILVIFIFMTVLLYLSLRFQNYKKNPITNNETFKEKVIDFVSRWGQHLEGLRNTQTFIYGVILAYGMKLGEASAIWGIQKSFGLELPVWSALLILAALNLTTIIPLAPGNIGVYEATVFFIYQHLGIEPEKAIALAITQHLCYLIPLAGTGYLYTLAKTFIRKKP